MSGMPPVCDQLAFDPTAKVETHRPDDRFVPIRACDLVEALADDVTRFGSAAAALRRVAKALHEVIEQEASAFEHLVCDCYANFNPDRDTIPLGDVKEARTPEGYAKLRKMLGYLLDKANFEELSDVQIEAALQAANSYGLRVRLKPERVQYVSIWVRGQSTIERQRVSWRAPLHGRKCTVSVFRRLVVIVRLKDNPCVTLKLFKEIPVEDVQALLPHAEVQMSWFDRALVVGGGAGTIGSTAMKVFSAAGSALAISKLLWVLAVGLGTLAFRTFMGYRRARHKNDSQRTQHLYYQNLNNNAGVLHSLMSMIAQEELKEAALAYAFCLPQVQPPVSSQEEFNACIGAYFKEKFKVQVSLDVADAFESITRFRLWSDAGKFRVVAPNEAVERLMEHWRSRRTKDYHQRTASGG
ncbi:MAG: DUF3754 domain-containing protein [Phycisphaerae bacterium]|nr:DUF3754 domain-containing protein [Phycisphaerae bacterium]